jgi:hypothetical protein
MVQLIAFKRGPSLSNADLEEIDALRSHDEIRHALSKKGVSFEGGGFTVAKLVMTSAHDP